MRSNIKEQLLSRVDYLAEYRNIGVTFDSDVPNSNGWIQCYAIDRDEKNPSAAVNVNNGFYTDLGNSDRRLDFFAMMQMFGGYADFKSVLSSFAEKYGISLPKRTTRTPDDQLTFMQWNGLGDRWCALKSTSREAVIMAGGEMVRYNQKYYCVAFKVFDDPENLDNAAGYVVSQANGEPVPVFDKNGNRTGECKIKTVSGTNSGFIGEYALRKIHEFRKEGPSEGVTVVKVEGVTDLLALTARIPEEMKNKVLVVTNSAGCAEKPKSQWAPVFQGMQVVVVHDCDQPGQKGAKNWVEFAQKSGADSVRNVVLPYAVTQNHGKDLKDFFTDGNSFSDFWKLVNSAELLQGVPEEAAAETYERPIDDPHLLAEMFLAQYSIEGTDKYSLFYRQQLWYVFNGASYRLVAEDKVLADVALFVDRIFQEAYVSAVDEWTGKGARPVKKKVTRSILFDTYCFLKALAIESNTDEIFIRFGELPEELKDLKSLVFVKNGIIATKELFEEFKRPDGPRPEKYFFPTTPQIFTLNCLDTQYDPEAKSDVWEKMIFSHLARVTGRGVSSGKCRVLQQFFGYCLIPSARLQKFLIMTGPGGNGKSSALMGFATMIGEQNISGVSLESFGERFVLNELRGKLVNIVDDLNDTDRNSEGKMKSIVSGVSISTDRKSKDPIAFVPYCRLIFSCNDLPRFRDSTDGIWRRLVVIPFENQIPDEMKDSRYVTREFWKKESSGILNWALRGLMDVYFQGWKLEENEEIRELCEQYREEMSPLSQFLDEKITEAGEETYISSLDLYVEYEAWAKKRGYYVENIRNLGRALKIKFPSAKRKKGRVSGWCYWGLRFKNGVLD